MGTITLIRALVERERVYSHAIDRLRELATDETEGEVYDLTTQLREAVEVCRVCRRLVEGRSLKELHDAFGAPGDFGYGSMIGDALATIYRGGAS